LSILSNFKLFLKEESNQKESDKVKDEYKQNYEMKQNQWKMEDVQQGNLEKLEKEKKKETKLFLNQIRKRPRFAQIYVDQYSLRDESVNKNIIEISKFLGRNLYEKKSLNMKIDKYLQELEKDELIKEENSIEDEDSLNKEQLMIHDMMLKNLACENYEEDDYNKIGINEKQEILNLVKQGRTEKTDEDILNEDFEMFQTFKNDVIKKETMYKSLGRTQFKNQILNYSNYSGTQVNQGYNTGLININKEYYENFNINSNLNNHVEKLSNENKNYIINYENVEIKNDDKRLDVNYNSKKIDSLKLKISQNYDENCVKKKERNPTNSKIKPNNKFSEENIFQEGINNSDYRSSDFLPPIKPKTGNSIDSSNNSQNFSKYTHKDKIDIGNIEGSKISKGNISKLTNENLIY